MKKNVIDAKKDIPFFKFFPRKCLAGLAAIGALLSSMASLSGCADGKDGANGKDGTVWYYGEQTDESQGKIGDFFYDTDDSAIYIKTENGWEFQGSLKGQDGKNGTDGSNGQNGEKGIDGAMWLSGTAIEGTSEGIITQVEGAKIGDLYLNTDTGNVYKCVAKDTWDYLTTLSIAAKKQDWKEDGTLKILSIGNSFSVDSQEWLYQIAKSIGVKRVVLGNLYIGGCTLATHLSNARNDASAYTYYTNEDGSWMTNENYQIDTAVMSENWDYITFQQASGYSGLADTYDDLQSLIDIVEPLCPKAKLVWNMTWAYQTGSTHVDFVNYGNNQTTMYTSIVNAVQTKILTNDDIDRVIPVGTAIQNARTSYLGDALTRDGFHLTYGVGRYIAGLCFAYGMTGLPIDSISYKAEGVTGGEKMVALEAVKNAFQNPYQVTNSIYLTDPETISEDDYDVVSLTWTKSAFYNSNLGQELQKNDSLSKYFWATQIFTKDDLPVGCIIQVASGWEYRPEGWISGASSGTRPDKVSTSKVEITDTWWGSWNQRAFNVAKIGTSTDISALTETELNNAFKIYKPKTTNA